MYDVLPAYVLVYHRHAVPKKVTRWGADPLELWLQMVLSHCVSGGNQSWVL